jgi:biotin-(acetyl-CoA carboxylase) ligase
MDLKETLISLCRFMDSRYLQLRSGDHAIIDHDYHHCLLGWDEWRSFTERGENFEGKIEGVDGYGHLLITDRKGTGLSFNLKEVEFQFDP